jgi:hypothetical protein
LFEAVTEQRNLSGTENCRSLWPTFNAKIATCLAPLLCKLFFYPSQDLIFFRPGNLVPLVETSFFFKKNRGAGLVRYKATRIGMNGRYTDVAACSRPSQNRVKSERHGELRFDIANLQCKGRHFSGPFALQIGVLPFSILDRSKPTRSPSPTPQETQRRNLSHSMSPSKNRKIETSTVEK